MYSSTLQRIIELWGVVEPDFDGHVMNERVTPAVVWAALSCEFGVDTARAEIISYLLQQGQREIDERTPTGDDMFLIGCCLELCKQCVDLDVDATKALLWTFSPVGYYREVRKLAARRFDQAQLLEALTEGLRVARNDMMRACIVYGVWTYLYEVPDSSDITLYPALVDFEAELRSIISRDNELLREVSENALQAIWILRGKRAYPSLDPKELAAYRVEERNTISHSLERHSDGYVVLAISRLEISERTLFVEYVNQEPSLLPEDVPSLLDTLLFPSHVPDYRVLAHVTFVDLVLKKVIERPLTLKRQ